MGVMKLYSLKIKRLKTNFRRRSKHVKIAIDKNILSNALDIVSKVISTKTTLPILEGVLLEAKDKTLQLTGNNLEIAIQHTVECEVIEAGAVVAEFKLLREIVQRLPDEEIDITADDKSMTIEAGQAKMEIRTMPANDYPIIQEIDGDTALEIDADDFRGMISGVSFAASQDETRPVLTTVCLELKDGVLSIVACDGFMIAVRKVECGSGDLKLLLKAVDLDKVYKIFRQGKVGVITNKNANVALLENDSTKAAVRVTEGTYLNYKNFMNDDAETTVRVKARDLKSTIERALLFADSGNEKTRLLPIDVAVRCDKLTVSTEGMRGRFDETIPAETTGEDLDIRLNPKQIYEILRHIEDEEVLLKFSGNIRPCIMTPVDGDKFFYMAVPVNPKKGA